MMAQEERSRQIMSAAPTGVAAAGNAYSASRGLRELHDAKRPYRHIL